MAKILISYRRADSAAIVGRIYDRLVARYGAPSVFLDIDDIPVGVDFRDHVRRALERADAVVAIVGPKWLGQRDGGARVLDVDDPVRVEIELTLAAGIPLCPVLVDGARMPGAAELPESLARFSFVNGIVVDAGRDFEHHAGRLIGALDLILGAKAPPPPAPPATALALRLRAYEAVAVVVATAAASGLAGIAPPWPPAFWIATAIAGAAVVAGAGTLFRSATVAVRRRLVVGAVVLLIATGSAYLFASSLYVYEIPATNLRLAKGFACTPEAQLLYKEKCPALGLDELRGAEYEAERLWTSQSIAIVRIALDLLWSLAFIGLATLAAAAASESRAGART